MRGPWDSFQHNRRRSSSKKRLPAFRSIIRPERPDPHCCSEFLRSVQHLLVVLVGLVVDNVEELELIDALGGRDDTEPVTELHLLEELLGPARISECGQSSMAQQTEQIGVWTGKLLTGT